MVWPFKWNLYSSTFTWYYLLSMWLNLLSLWIDHSYETSSTFFSHFQLIFQCIFNFYISLFERVPKLSINPIFPLKGTQRVNEKQNNVRPVVKWELQKVVFIEHGIQKERASISILTRHFQLMAWQLIWYFSHQLMLICSSQPCPDFQ